MTENPPRLAGPGPRGYPFTAARRGAVALGLCGAVMLVCFALMTRLDHFTREGHAYLGYFYGAFALYGLALLILARLAARTGRVLLLIGVFAVLFRTVLWLAEPSLSTDVWRYIWDGRLIDHGVNPYVYRVDAPQLDWLATPLRQRIDHAWMATPYPPAAELVFAGAGRVWPDHPATLQIVFTLFDLGAAVVIVALLREYDRPDTWVLLYLWNPLVVVESAHGAHVDSMMAFFSLLALYWLVRGQKTASAAALALATLTKLIPALLLPVFVVRWGLKRTLLYGLLVALCFVPFLGAGLGVSGASDGTGLFGAVRIYTTQWKTNDGLFYWLVQAVTPYTADPIGLSRRIAQAAVGLAGGVVLLRSFRHRTPPVIAQAAGLISVYLLLSAAMFPWYLVWLIALLPLLPWDQDKPTALFVAGWLYFSAAVNLSYLFYLDPAHPGEIMWVRYVEYVPLLALLSAALGLRLAPDLRTRFDRRQAP